MFPTGLVLGVYNKFDDQTMLNPPAARRIQQGDVLVMMRPTSVAPEHYKPIEKPVPIDLGRSCLSERYIDLILELCAPLKMKI